MEQHPIPREITSFEFKLIGFMTLHQFLYLVVFFPSAFIIYKIIPIPIINILFALITVAAGVAFAFLPFQDRPLDVWLKNLWTRMNAPTQYTYHKSNPPVSVLNDLYYVSDPHKTYAHIESREMLSSYLQRTQPKPTPSAKRASIQSMLRSKPKAGNVSKPMVQAKGSTPLPKTLISEAKISTKPVLIGNVQNNKKIPLPGILIYIKTKDKKPLRLLKTNPHGIFATFHPIPTGDYIIEPKDPKGGYFFDTMNLSISEKPVPMLHVSSKEIL